MIKRLYTRLIIDGQIIENNFTCEITRQLNWLQNIAKIKVKKLYYQAAGLNVNTDTTIQILTGYSTDSLTSIFLGKVSKVQEKDKEIELIVSSNPGINDSCVMTLEDLPASLAFRQLFSVSYLMEDVTLERAIFQDTKRHAFFSLISTIRGLLPENRIGFYSSRENQTVVTTQANSKVIDDIYPISVSTRKLKMMIYPTLELLDTVSVQGKTLVVTSIRINIQARSSYMICEVVDEY